MNRIRFRLDLPADIYLAYYRGDAREVVVTALDGRRLRFPASILRPFVEHGGVRGEFVLEYDAGNRFNGIRRVGN